MIDICIIINSSAGDDNVEDADQGQVGQIHQGVNLVSCFTIIFLTLHLSLTAPPNIPAGMGPIKRKETNI